MKLSISYIYILLFPSGKRYVGQTIQTVEKRMKRHWSPSKREYFFPVHNAMRKYGKEGTKIEKVLALRCTQEYLDLIEQRAIKHYNTLFPYGYNLTEGGCGGAKSKETRAKISMARTLMARMGQPNPMKGRHHSKESRMKMSVAKKGKPRRPHSEETRTKISVAMKGKFKSKESIAKRVAARKANLAMRSGV